MNSGCFRRAFAAALLATLGAHAAQARPAAAPFPMGAFVRQTPLPGFEVDGNPPVLYVSEATNDRQVFLCWMPPAADPLAAAREVARERRDSCVVEWQAGSNPIVRETWWLDRARGLAVCPDGVHWYTRTWGQETWNLRCRALELDPAGGGYAPSTLDYALDEAASIHGRPDDSGAKEGDSVYVEALPEVSGRVSPEYPEAARARKVEGIVIVKALVDTSGTVSKTLVFASVPMLDASAVDAVRQWTFRPARSNGKAIRVWVAVPVRFSLH